MPKYANRKQDLATYEHKYTYFCHDKDNPFICFYCGEKASTIDHVPPISRVDDYRSFRLTHEMFIKVSCCVECNSILSAVLHTTIMDRVDYLHDKLERRYKRHLKCRVWTKQDVKEAEFTGELKKYIEASEALRAKISYRITFNDGINAFLASLGDTKSLLSDPRYY